MKKFLICIMVLLFVSGVSVYFINFSYGKNMKVSEEIEQETVYNDVQNSNKNIINILENNPTSRNNIFSEYLKTVEDNVNKLNENLTNDVFTKSDIGQIDSKIIERYRTSGIAFSCSEGSCYARIDYKYIYDIFNKVLTPEYNEYLLIMNEEANNPYASDGGIIVPFEIIRKRMVRCEKFLKQYPNFIRNNEIKESMIIYSYAYKNGLDNTPVKCSKEENFSNPELRKDIVNSYAIYLKKTEDKNSDYYKEIENCYSKIR